MRVFLFTIKNQKTARNTISFKRKNKRKQSGLLLILLSDFILETNIHLFIFNFFDFKLQF